MSSPSGDIFIVGFPQYVRGIIEIISSDNWIVHNFKDRGTEEIFNPAAFLRQKELNKVNYSIVIDLNIFQYMVNAYKRDSSKDLYRKSIAYLSFFQLADIQIDPTYAIYEKISLNIDKVDEAVEDLRILTNVNNLDNRLLSDYAFGNINSIKTHNDLENLNAADLSEKLKKTKWLNGWRSLYAVVLSVVNIEFRTHKSPDDKINEFILWSLRNFRISLPGLIFAVAALGHKRVGGIMKYKTSDSASNRRSAVMNMAWDLYYADQYFKKWLKNDGKTEVMLLTKDAGFKYIINLCIDIQRVGSLIGVHDHIKGVKEDLLLCLMNPKLFKEKRAYKSEVWSEKYTESIIVDFERNLLG